MKPGKAAMALLSVVLLSLAVMGGFFLGRNTVAGPVRVITRSNTARLPQPDSGETQKFPVTQSELPEKEDETTFPININTATAEELQALPGIGKTRAEAIVAYREEHGPFTYVEDLRAVSGIGEGILANIMDYITVGEQSNGKNISG